MRRFFIAAALLTAALAVPAGAGAGSTITLRENDEFGVKKSHILCVVQVSKTFIPGQKVVACFFVPTDPTKGPVPNSYAVALAVNGEVALAKVGSDGKLKVVMTRGGKSGPPQQPLGRTGRLSKVGLGSVLLVKNSAVTCAVNTQKFAGKPAKTVACFKVDAQKKPRPNSYGVGITDGGAFLVHFDAQSKGSPVKVVQHGK